MKAMTKNEISRLVDKCYNNLIINWGLRNALKISLETRRRVLLEEKRRKSLEN